MSKETRNMKNHISGIYSIRNLVTGKVYVGQSKSCTIRWRGHLWSLKNDQHGNVHLQASFNRYGVENFQYEVLETCAEDARDERECYWMDYHKSNDLKFGYNLQYGGHLNKNHSDETKEKQRQAKLGTILIEEHKRKIGLASKGNTHRLGKYPTEETRRKMSKSQKGKVISEENIRKLREANLGKKVSAETRRKMSIVHKGKSLSEEHKRKISESEKGEKHHFYGKTFSLEYRQKLSDAHKGRVPSEETRKKLREAHVGKVISEEIRKKLSAARMGYKAPEEVKEKARKPVTEEMINDVKSGMTQMKFQEKHNYGERIWVRIKKTILINGGGYPS